MDSQKKKIIPKDETLLSAALNGTPFVKYQQIPPFLRYFSKNKEYYEASPHILERDLKVAFGPIQGTVAFNKWEALKERMRGESLKT